MKKNNNDILLQAMQFTHMGAEHLLSVLLIDFDNEIKSKSKDLIETNIRDCIECLGEARESLILILEGEGMKSMINPVRTES